MLSLCVVVAASRGSGGAKTGTFADTVAATVARALPVVLRDTPLEAWPARRWTPRTLAARLTEPLRAVYVGAEGEGELTYFNESLELVNITAARFFEICDHSAGAGGSSRSARRHRHAHYSASLEQWRASGLHRDVTSAAPLAASDPFSAFGAQDATVWMASAGVVSTAHFDSQRNFFAQLYGRKTFTLWPPSAVHRMMLPPKADRTRGRSAAPGLDLDGAAFARGRATFVLAPGDVLYIPPFWFHRVEAESTSISLSLWTESEATLAAYRAAERVALPFEREWPARVLEAAAAAFISRIARNVGARAVSFFLFTVTFYANLAHSLTRSP